MNKSAEIIFFQDCYALLSVICSLGYGCIIYRSGTSLIRYLYVRSSLVADLQQTLKRDSFVLKSIIIGEALIYFTLGSFYFQDIEMVLYHACLDPWAEFKFPIHKVLPLNQLVIFCCVLVSVSCNIFLYRFLAKQTKNNSALTENDKKKNRKRNLIRPNTTKLIFAWFTSTREFQEW